MAGKRKDEVVMIREIAKAVDASPAFLAKIFQLLNSAGLVTSSRGVVGGFRLSRPAQEINLREILEATEGPISVNICVVDEKSCERAKNCVAHEVWSKMRDKINNELEKISLKKLLDT